MLQSSYGFGRFTDQNRAVIDVIIVFHNFFTIYEHTPEDQRKTMKLELVHRLLLKELENAPSAESANLKDSTTPMPPRRCIMGYRSLGVRGRLKHRLVYSVPPNACISTLHNWISCGELATLRPGEGERGLEEDEGVTKEWKGYGPECRGGYILIREKKILQEKYTSLREKIRDVRRSKQAQA